VKRTDFTDDHLLWSRRIDLLHSGAMQKKSPPKERDIICSRLLVAHTPKSDADFNASTEC